MFTRSVSSTRKGYSVLMMDVKVSKNKYRPCQKMRAMTHNATTYTPETPDIIALGERKIALLYQALTK